MSSSFNLAIERMLLFCLGLPLGGAYLLAQSFLKAKIEKMPWSLCAQAYFTAAFMSLMVFLPLSSQLRAAHVLSRLAQEVALCSIIQFVVIALVLRNGQGRVLLIEAGTVVLVNFAAFAFAEVFLTP